MAQRVVRMLQGADQFGAVSQIIFFNNDSRYKTVYGGLLSLLIYSLGLAYFLYIMILWFTYQIDPSVTSQSNYIEGPREFNISSTFFAFSFEANNLDLHQNLTKLEKKGLIYDYNFINYDKNFTEEQTDKNAPGFNCSQKKGSIDFFNPLCIDVNDINQTLLKSNTLNRQQKTYIKFQIGYCDPAFNSQCLSFDDQKQVLDDVSFWRLTVYEQDIDLKTRDIITIPKDFYFSVIPYENFTSKFIDLRLTVATYIIDTGIIFPKLETIQLIKGIEIIPLDLKQRDHATNNPLIANVIYTLENQQYLVRITYPKLGQILAQLGSIFQTLLLSGLIMNMFNHSLLYVKIEEQLLKIYFPQLRFFTFQYSWRGNIRKIFNHGEALPKTEFDQMKLFSQRSGKHVRSKLHQFNILYDISRSQLQIQKDIPKEQFVKLKDLGYKMNLSDELDSPCKLKANHIEQLFEYEDFLHSCSDQKYYKSGGKPLMNLVISEEQFPFDASPSSMPMSPIPGVWPDSPKRKLGINAIK